MSEESQPNRWVKIKQHLQDNKKIYLISVGSALTGASVATLVVLTHTKSWPLEVSQTAKNTALLVWKPEIHQIALVKNACPDPIPVLDKLTGIPYPSINNARKVTGLAFKAIRDDAFGDQKRWERLSNSIFA